MRIRLIDDRYTTGSSNEECTFLTVADAEERLSSVFGEPITLNRNEYVEVPDLPTSEPAQPVPTPYEVKRIGAHVYIEPVTGGFVCDMQAGDMAEDERPGMESTAEFITRACNAHNDLVSALRDCIESLARLEDKPDAYRVTCMTQARAALAKAQ